MKLKEKIKKVMAVFLLLVFLAPVISQPLIAHAQLDFGTGGLTSFGQSLPTGASTGGLNLGPGTDLTSFGQSLGVPTADFLTELKSWYTSIQATLTAVGINAPNPKDLLNGLIKQLLIMTIRIMKQMAINYIVTGNAGAPLFVTNFQANLQQNLDNAARSYLSQLTGINFCSFFPPVQQSVISINFNLQLQCAVNSDLYAQYLRNPASVGEIGQLLAMDPSVNYLQTIINAGQQQTQNLAQAAIAQATEVSAGGGFLGDAENIVTPTDQAAADAATQQKAEAARQAAIGNAVVNNPQIDNTQLQQIGQAAYNAALQNPVAPKTTRQIKTPGSAVADVVKNALGSEWTTIPQVSQELYSAITDIVNVMVGQLGNYFIKGLVGSVK